MTAQFPLHPDDEKELLHVRRYLIGFRITNGWTQKELSPKINGTHGMVYDLESNETWQWRLSRLQNWVLPFGLRLTAKLSFPDELRGVEEMVQDDPEVAPLFHLATSGDKWPYWQRLYLTAALTAARKHQDISREELGNRLGITRKAVWGWESTANDVMLLKVLHHARVLGGWIDLELEDADGLPH